MPLRIMLRLKGIRNLCNHLMLPIHAQFLQEAVTIESPQKKTVARPSKRKAPTADKERLNSEGVDPDVLEVEVRV